MESTLRSVFETFNRNIEPPVRQHLRNVYACLTMSTLVAAIGAYVHIFTNLLSAGFLPAIVGLGLLMALKMTPDDHKNKRLRVGYLLGFSFCAGLGMGPLLDYAIRLNPSIIVSAFIGTSVIFASFTLSALYSPRGYFLFLAGPLMSVLSTLMILSLANILFGSYLLYQANLYIGLLAMCGFVIYDTALIMEKRRMGDKDFIGHSIELFIDFIGIFKRIVIILSQKEENEQQRRKRQ